MLTIRHFKKINGHIPEVSLEGIHHHACCECSCGRSPVRICYRNAASLHEALNGLARKVLRRHASICMENYGWRCGSCGSVSGLTAHHKVFRSHGRNDRVENLIPLCYQCHSAIHRSTQGIGGIFLG
jgi:5-methylcytosine-specific restriction endonuclease McrA